MLCEILINIIKEKEVVISDVMNNIDKEILFQLMSLDIKKISLIVLIEGGAEMLIAMKINHQNTMLGDDDHIPLNDKMLRDEYFVYKSLVSMNKADDDIPCAIIMMIAPERPKKFILNNPMRTNPMCATDE